MNGCSFYSLASVCGRKKIGPADINDDVSKVSGVGGLRPPETILRSRKEVKQLVGLAKSFKIRSPHINLWCVKLLSDGASEEEV